jgi:hypothetical protein
VKGSSSSFRTTFYSGKPRRAYLLPGRITPSPNARFSAPEYFDLWWMPNHRAGNHHRNARPSVVVLHQQSSAQPQVLLRGLWMRASTLLLTSLFRCSRTSTIC